MPNPHRFYLLHLHDKSGYRASWFPDKPLKIGDVGKLENGLFTVYTTLQMEGIPLQTRPGKTESSLDYTSHNSIAISTQAKASTEMAANVKGGGIVKIEFKSNEGIVFQTMGCTQHIIENLGEVESEVLKRYKDKKWNPEWVVISEIMQADNSTIIISTSNNNIVELEAKAEANNIKAQLADASLGLKVVWEQGSCIRYISSAGLTPLYQIKGIRHPLFGNPKFRTRSGSGNGTNGFNDLPFDTNEVL